MLQSICIVLSLHSDLELFSLSRTKRAKVRGTSSAINLPHADVIIWLSEASEGFRGIVGGFFSWRFVDFYLEIEICYHDYREFRV